LQAIPTVAGAIDAGRTIIRQSLQKISLPDSFGVNRKWPAHRGPERISVARLPVTGKEVFGREEDLAFLDAALANSQVNVVSVVAWADPITPDGNGGFKKTIPVDQSSGQLIAALLLEGAELVKAFGTLGAQSVGSGVNRSPERAGPNCFSRSVASPTESKLSTAT
jgi:hypothetical protein